MWPEVLEGTGVPMCGQRSLKVREGAHVWPEVLEGTGVPMCGQRSLKVRGCPCVARGP